MLMHNALRLPFPFEVPGLDVELFPFYRFDRLDVQRDLLDDVLLGAARGGDPTQAEELRPGQPRLMIATTDLTYGFQVGFLPDGLLKLGEGIAGQDVYRGETYEPEASWSPAERVAVSGAFPIAFPPRPFRVRFV